MYQQHWGDSASLSNMWIVSQSSWLREYSFNLQTNKQAFLQHGRSLAEQFHPFVPGTRPGNDEQKLFETDLHEEWLKKKPVERDLKKSMLLLLIN